MLVLVSFIAVSTIVAVIAYIGLRIRKLSSDAIITNTQVGNLGVELNQGMKKAEADISRLDSKDLAIMNSTNTNKQELQNALSVVQAELGKADLRKGGSITGNIDVNGTTKTSTLKLEDKWTLSGKGDAHANDDWLRFFGKDGKDYYGGVAAGRLWSKDSTETDTLTARKNISVGGDIVMEGTNKWILHTPDDGRKTMYIAPSDGKNGWQWDRQTRLEADGVVAVQKLLSAGNLETNGDIVMDGSNKWILHTPDDGRKTMYIAPSDGKTGWQWDKQVRFEPDGTLVVNKMLVNGTTKTNSISLGDKWTLSGVGDAHANDDWLRFLGNDGKDYYGGIAAGRLWSGGPVYVNGDLSVSGTTNVGGTVSLNDKQLRIRGPGDPNHFIAWSRDVDGPRIQGHVGGQLGTNHAGDRTILQWSNDGVNINGNIKGTQSLCLGSTCVDETQLKKLLV